MTKVVLSEGHVSPDSLLSVTLIKNHHPETRPMIVITWPAHITECSPRKLAEVVSNACRLLGNANLELARRRIIQPGSE